MFDPGGAPRIGDVTAADDGTLHARFLDNAGQGTWVCLDGIDERLQAIVVSMLKTIRWTYEENAEVPQQKTQKHRKSSIYNLHISAVLRRLAEIAPEMSRTERMQTAVKTWLDLAKTAVTDAQKREASRETVAALEQRVAGDNANL
jgi:hypothetical protein